MRGHSTLIASLIYGLTHTLPGTLLPNLTFTTYESTVQESEFLITGTINGTELQDLTRLQVQPDQAAGPLSEDIQRYVTVAVSSLVNNNMEKLNRLIDEIDRRDHASVDDLIELFKRRFRFGELTLKQLGDIMLHPADNVEDLLDPAFQTEAAQLLLTYPDYWEPRGKEVFQKVKGWLAPGAKTTLNEQTREALSRCLNGMAEYLFSIIRKELAQGTMPRQSIAILGVIAHPSINPDLYLRMLTEFAQEPLHRQITSDGLWPFHLWLLSCANLMQPRPTREQMLPWLSIPSWEKLDRVLKLGLPAEWESAAMFEPVMSKRDISKSAMGVIKAYETKFTAFMRDNLKQGSQFRNQNFITVGLRLFEAIIRFDEQASKNNEPEYSYPNRVALLLNLLNAAPNDPGVIESLFLIVQFASPYQLTVSEFGSVVAGCQPEVMAARSASPSLMTYIQEFIVTLTPKQLMYKNTLMLLEQFQQSTTLTASSDTVARSVNFWLAIHKFLTAKVFNENLLQNIKPALEYLAPQFHQRGQDIWQTFIQEMVPDLVALVKTEYHLESVLYVFEGAYIVASWDLLNALAICAGEALAEKLDRLIPYLLCGIREHSRTGFPREALDAYLQRLFNRASDTTLIDIDKATLNRIWPDLINAEWKGWRDRTKTSWKDKLVGKKTNTQQQKPSTGPQPPQPLPINPNHTFGTSQPDQRGQFSPNPASPVASPMAPQPQMPNSVPPAALQAQHSHTANPAPVITPERVVQPQIQKPPPQRELRINVTIGELLYPIPVNNYEQVRHIWSQALQYWYLMLNATSNKARSKGITDELNTIKDLQDDLKKLPATLESGLLIQYFVDDLLINLEIEQLSQTQDEPFLHSSNYILGRLEEFKSSIGTTNYQYFSKSVTEQAIKETLQKLIRRYHFIQYMEQQNKEWNKWLNKERKSAKYECQKVPARA